jgi:hypothetical protein
VEERAKVTTPAVTILLGCAAPLAKIETVCPSK